jgi:hypothetical protein
MRKLRTAVLAGAAALLVAGAAEAATAKFKTMNVALPDGSVATVRYVGDVAPRIVVQPVDARTVAMPDPFLELERISAMMEAQSRAMWQRAAEMQRQAAAAPNGTVLVGGKPPAGTTVHYSYVSTTSNGTCTQTVEYRSDGSGKAPQVTQASAGDCGSARQDAPVVPAAANVSTQAGVPAKKT